MTFSGHKIGMWHRKILIVLAVAGVAACSSASTGQITTNAISNQSATTAKSATEATSATRTATSSGGSLSLLIEPKNGIGPIYQLINKARSSIDLTMYELNDSTAEADLAAAAARGVDVKVLLDQHLEKSRNTAAYSYLAAHKVHVHWAAAGTTYHQKTLTVDGATSVIMTLNLVSSDYSGTRDFAVIDTRHTDVAAITATFNADFADQSITPPDGADLVWSPTNAQSSVLSVINGAKHTLAVEDEEMDDPAVTSALASAARRGVDVQVVMTADSEWDSAFTELARAGVHVRTYADSSGVLYIHAKAIIADVGRSGQRALIGSQNFSEASLDYNRELGILTTDSAIIKAAAGVIASDYAGARAYSPGGGSGGGSGSGSAAHATCTASATVYDASRDENNVAVHSNQPDTDATASADGYSHSYRTSSSGYALIYLNGPKPGAKITVKVGSATCTTSD